MDKEREKIKLFSYYGCRDFNRQRYNSPAADTKTDYIIDVLNRIGSDVDCISLAPSSESHNIRGSFEKIGHNTIRFFSSFGRDRNFLRVFNRWFMGIQFILC